MGLRARITFNDENIDANVNSLVEQGNQLTNRRYRVISPRINSGSCLISSMIIPR